MDLRTQSSLIAALLSLALATSVLLRSRKRRSHWLFTILGLSVSAYYLSSFALRVFGGELLARLNLACGVLLPLAAVQFFRVFVDEDHPRMTRVSRAAVATAVLLLTVAFTPFYDHKLVFAAMTLYVGVFLFAALSTLWALSRTAVSRLEAGRLQYLTLVGGLAAIFTLVDYLPFFGLDIPPVGTVLVLIFLYVLSQSIVRQRLIDLYELVGRLGVLLALGFMLATMLWLLAYAAGERYFLHSLVAAMVVLVLFEPLRTKVGQWISQMLFRERFDLEQTLLDLRQRISHVLEVDDLTRVLLDGLERSRRFTHAAIYLADEDLRGYNLAASFGGTPEPRVEAAPARPLLDRLAREGALVLERSEEDLLEKREVGDFREAETLYDIVQSLEALRASICLAIRGEQGELYGLLCLRDERARDTFSPAEVELLGGLAAQVAITVENSRLYLRMKERDRLAALGEMAAGLAHEIRNPLGAIKASAQYLTEPGHESEDGDREFLDIIVEEVDRLNRVVASFLDYARPYRGNPSPTDVNAIVDRTLQLLAPECSLAHVEWRVAAEPDLPPVRIDPEQLRQVVINLVQNAVQAMEGGGRLVVETALRVRDDIDGATRRWVEVRVTDTGPGIPLMVRKNLFVPFVTTKDRGTGLGLAISQRIVATAGGSIQVRSHEGLGATFVVRLPAADEARAAAEDAQSEGGAARPEPLGEAPGSGSGPTGEASDEPADRPRLLTTSR